ncbi:MAG: XkdX family protein [Lachnospiraceae bacterium]|nr:XkdX family protein [Lachnospiraceae bacterium]MBR2653252.1 XkdX family protein [Lachnospiraceae bacterium]
MSKIAELAGKNYPENWNREMLRNLVEKGRLTEEEFKKITGDDDE